MIITFFNDELKCSKCNAIAKFKENQRPAFCEDCGAKLIADSFNFARLADNLGNGDIGPIFDTLGGVKKEDN